MQNDFCLEVFATSKDKTYHIEAIARDQHFWRYVTCTQRFASMVDERGRWSAQCSCHEVERRVSASVVCGKPSRWLHEAPGANAVFMARVESHERLLNLVEGDQALLLKALTAVRRFRSDATVQRFHISSCLRRVLRRPKRYCGRPEQAMRTRTILSLVNSWNGLRPTS